MAQMIALIFFSTLLLGCLAGIIALLRTNAAVILAALDSQPTGSGIVALPVRSLHRFERRRSVQPARFSPLALRAAA